MQPAPSFIHTCQQLARAVAPELVCPLYIVLPGHGLPHAACAAAWTPVSLIHAPLRELLIAQGEWRGPGIAIVFEEVSRVLSDAIGVFLHELAHNLPARPLPADRAPSPDRRALQFAALRRWADVETEQSPPDVEGHGFDFTRICCHLHYRAVWHSPIWRHETWQDLSVDRLCVAGADYHMSHAHSYALALGDEPARLLDATFKEILSTPAPRAFQELWQADLQRRKQLREVNQ